MKLPSSVFVRLSRCIEERDTLAARVAELESEAKQAREDEAWALSNEIEVKALEHGRWKLTWWTENAIEQSFDESIHAALRALREKMEAKP